MFLDIHAGIGELELKQVKTSQKLASIGNQQKATSNIYSLDEFRLLRNVFVSVLLTLTKKLLKMLAMAQGLSTVFVSSAKHRHYEKTLKSSSGKGFIYGKLLHHTNKVSLRFLLRDTLHEAFFTGC